jgi:hypothetical protein
VTTPLGQRAAAGARGEEQLVRVVMPAARGSNVAGGGETPAAPAAGKEALICRSIMIPRDSLWSGGSSEAGSPVSNGGKKRSPLT